MTEIYKFFSGLSPPIVNKIFKIKYCPWSLRNPGSLIIKSKLTVKYGIDSIVCKGSLIWQTLSTDLRNSELLFFFDKNLQLLNSKKQQQQKKHRNFLQEINKQTNSNNNNNNNNKKQTKQKKVSTKITRINMSALFYQ